MAELISIFINGTTHFSTTLHHIILAHRQPEKSFNDFFTFTKDYKIIKLIIFENKTIMAGLISIFINQTTPFSTTLHHIILTHRQPVCSPIKGNWCPGKDLRQVAG